MNLFNQFSRITTSGRRFLPQIDGLRFVAIMAVIAYHVRSICAFHLGVSLDSEVGSEGLVNRVFEVGHLGVEFFFAISGFILALPFAEQHLRQGDAVSLRKYYLRRLTRLEPPYIINLVVCFLLCWLVFRHLSSHPHLYHQSDWAAYTAQHILASLVYCNGFIFAAHPYPNIVLWSLEIEVQFYLLAPFITLLFKIPPPLVRRAIMVALILADSIFGNTVFGYWVAASLLGNLQFFLVGFLICDFYVTEWTEDDRRSLWDVFFLLAMGAVIFCHRQSLFSYALPWLILVSLAAAFKSVVFRWFLSLPWVSTIGGMCYTIYMYHWFLISALIRLTIRLQAHVFWLDLIIQVLVMSAIIIPISALLFMLFERPFMQRNWPVTFWNSLSSWKRARP